MPWCKKEFPTADSEDLRAEANRLIEALHLIPCQTFLWQTENGDCKCSEKNTGWNLSGSDEN